MDDGGRKFIHKQVGSQHSNERNVQEFSIFWNLLTFMSNNKKSQNFNNNYTFKIQFAVDIKIPYDIKHSACLCITRVFINRKRIFVWSKHQQTLMHFSDLDKDFAMILSTRTMVLLMKIVMLLMKMVMLLMKMVMLLVKMVGAGMLSLTRSANFHHKQRRWKPNSACPIYQQTVGGEVGREGGGGVFIIFRVLKNFSLDDMMMSPFS